MMIVSVIYLADLGPKSWRFGFRFADTWIRTGMSKDREPNWLHPAPSLLPPIKADRSPVRLGELAKQWMAGMPATPKRQIPEYNSASKPKERQTQQRRIRELLPAAFPPDGRPPVSFSLKAIKARLDPLFEKNSLTGPSTDSIARALGRRDRPRG
ncbi:hypothetical protein IVB02_29700 [Bradyrhizobium sp. 166]|uniref:hypothetical protein n=1 Tax=Bradyrhizobium sp. 166 TaxID=2782638 RepID=UPI001FFBD48E|nr:hypothetical protein [Bradyrhizobium sp. 166]MCK1605461.1 hypothetical protein [Bradyrhizobium sp. 166]